MCSYRKKKVQDFALSGSCTDYGYIFVVNFLLICHKFSGKSLFWGTPIQRIRRCFAVAYFPSRISGPAPLNRASPNFCHTQQANRCVTDEIIPHIWNIFQETPVQKQIFVTTPLILLDAVRLLLTELKSGLKLRFILQPYDPCLEIFIMPGFALHWYVCIIIQIRSHVNKSMTSTIGCLSQRLSNRIFYCQFLRVV
jgi:hypothetical protein